MVSVSVRSKALEHDVQADQSVLPVVESLRHRGEDPEAQRQLLGAGDEDRPSAIVYL